MKYLTQDTKVFLDSLGLRTPPIISLIIRYKTRIKHVERGISRIDLYSTLNELKISSLALLYPL